MNTPEDENKDPVWEMLKESRPVEPSAFFSRNVVREVRRLEAESSASGFWARSVAWLRETLSASPSTVIASIAAVAVLAIALNAFGPSGSQLADNGAPVSADPVITPDAPAAAEETATPAELASTGTTSEFDPAQEISNLDYLGELMAVTDPSLLDDNALADLLF